MREYEIQRLAEKILGEWLSIRGFNRTDDSSGWFKRVESGFFILRFQKFAEFKPAGCHVLDCVFELRTPHPRLPDDGDRLVKGARSYLDSHSANEFHRLNKIVVDKLRPPGRPSDFDDQWISRELSTRMSRRVRMAEGREFLWYQTREHVKAWMEFTRSRLEHVITCMQEQRFADDPSASADDLSEYGYKPPDAIIAAPHDDAPRQMFADWLDERGDPRGAFIRLQCQLALMNSTEEESAKNYKKAIQLQRDHGAHWLATTNDLPISDPVFHRGFVEEVSITAKDFARSGAEIFGVLPLLSHVNIKPLRGPILELARAGEIQRVRGLHIADASEYDWQEFLSSGEYPNLQSIYIAISSLTPELRKMMANSLVSRLRAIRIDCNTNRVSKALGLVLNQLNPDRIRALSLQNNDSIGGGNAFCRQLANCESLCNLTHLDLRATLIGDEGIEVLSNSGTMRQLRFLSLIRTGITGRAVDAICQSENFQNLRVVEVSRSELYRTPEAVERLLARFPFARIRGNQSSYGLPWRHTRTPTLEQPILPIQSSLRNATGTRCVHERHDSRIC